MILGTYCEIGGAGETLEGNPWGCGEGFPLVSPARAAGPMVDGPAHHVPGSRCCFVDLGAAMIICMGGDHEHQGDEPDSGDAFDRRVGSVLDEEADLLGEQAEFLLASGSISVERPAGVVTARFRRPVWRQTGFLTWHRRPGLDIDAMPADDSGRRAWEHGPMVAKYRDRAALLREITLKLAIYLAWLEEDE